MTDPLVTLILPIRNESTYIGRCLQAILAQDYPGPLEVLIVDGMSSDGTRQLAQDFIARHPGLDVRLLDNPGRIVPTGMNVALQKAKGDVMIRVDGHCVIYPDYVSKCVHHLQKEKVAGVGGPMESIGETGMAMAIAVAMSSPFGVGNSAFRTTSGKSMLVDTVPFPAYTREIIEHAGCYDEELVRNQDDEYNYRIRGLGGSILLADDVRSTYFSRTSLKGLWRQYFQYGYWKVRVLQKHPYQMSFRQFVPPAFVFALFLSFLFLFFPAAYPLFLIVPLLYLAANLGASVRTAAKKGWKYFPYLPLTFAILHLSYGLGFLIGLVKFADRWRDRQGRVPDWPREEWTT